MSGETRMSGPRVAAASVLVFTFCIAFAALALLPIKVPVYIPLQHLWERGMPDPPRIGMDFYGRALYALIAGATAAAAAGLAAAKWNPRSGSGAVRMLALYAFVSVALPVFIYCYTLLFK